jgi:hypothetical protein
MRGHSPEHYLFTQKKGPGKRSLSRPVSS